MREKVLAAQRAGLKRVILPRENVHDLDDLPAETKKELEFVLVDGIEEVLEHAFTPKGRRPPARAERSLERQAAASRSLDCCLRGSLYGKTQSVRLQATERTGRMAKTKEKLYDAADTMRPYVDRALHDDDAARQPQGSVQRRPRRVRRAARATAT